MQASSNGFQIVNRKICRGVSTVMGTKKSGNLLGSRPAMDMFVARISKVFQLTTFAVLSHMKGSNYNILIVFLIIKLPSSLLKSKYFGLMKKKIMSVDFWPEYVTCHSFIPLRRDRQLGSDNNNCWHSAAQTALIVLS